MAKIMIVDDEKDVRDTITMLLEIEGHQVTACESGEKCLAQLDATQPDLILMDFFMPGISGLETIKKIRENPAHNQTKIIFLTIAEFRKKGLEKLKKIGVTDYIRKPFETTQLTQKIQHYLKNE